MKVGKSGQLGGEFYLESIVYEIL